MENTEKIRQENGEIVEVYENEILYYFDEYIQERNIKDFSKESQSKWNSCMMYIYKSCFKNTDKLKSKKLYDNPNKNISITKTNYNSYDLDIIDNLCDLYIFLCMEYDKEVSLMGFHFLTGIDTDTFETWGRGGKKIGGSESNKKGMGIYRKLVDTRQETLSDRLFSGKGNPVGVLGILNRWYGWNMGQPHGTQAQKVESLEEIQEKYRGIEEKSGRPALEDKPTE